MTRAWSNWREALDICVDARHLRRSLAVAVVVGTILGLINQADLVVTGRATALVWFKLAVTYVVPFCVANYGILVATRRRD